MSASATLKHEEKFERHLFGLVAGGFLGGLTASILEIVVGREVEALTALSFAAVVGLVINQLDPREDTALMRLVFALMGGVLMGAIGVSAIAGAAWWAAGAGGALLGLALTVNRTETLRRRLTTCAVFAAALAAGAFTSTTLFESGVLAVLDEATARHALTGTTWGLFLAVAAGLSDLKWERDSLVGRLDEAISRHGDLVGDYLESARELYRQIGRECERAEQDDTRLRAAEIAAATVESLLRLADRFRELRRSLQTTGGKRLERRIERIERRLEQTQDASLAREVERARDEAYEQLQMRQRIELACTRLESRLQRCVTTLEKLHLTLVQHATSTNEDGGLGEALNRLEQLAEEVELKSLSVDELCSTERVEAAGLPEDQSDAQVVAAEATLTDSGVDGALDDSPIAPDAGVSDEEETPGESSDDRADEPSQEETRHEQVVAEHDASC
jgi:hypothetical protein